MKLSQTDKKHKYEKYGKWVLIVLAAAGVAGAGYLYFIALADMNANVAQLESVISDLRVENMALEESLYREQQKNADFQNQIGEIASTVGRLDKLSKTDRELLQKYSKVYFLNENYVPENLTNIPSDYLNNQNRPEEIHTKVYPYLRKMIEDARKAGIDLKIISAYRSFGEQGALKNSYTVVYGSGANKFSADQGYSEHQLGTTLDFTTAQLGSEFTSFKSSDGYEWLLDNAYRYGFILSYPEGNSFYQFEPWHWRFVGKSLANYLHQEGLDFYDLDQRKIDNYLIKIFD